MSYYFYTENNFGAKAESLHSLKADAAYMTIVIRHCLAIRKLSKFIFPINLKKYI